MRVDSSISKVRKMVEGIMRSVTLVKGSSWSLPQPPCHRPWVAVLYLYPNWRCMDSCSSLVLPELTVLFCTSSHLQSRDGCFRKINVSGFGSKLDFFSTEDCRIWTRSEASPIFAEAHWWSADVVQVWFDWGGLSSGEALIWFGQSCSFTVFRFQYCGTERHLSQDWV